MNILVINWQDIRNPFGGGAEVHFHELFRRIAAKGHQVTLLCCSFAGAANTEMLDGIEIIRIASRNSFNFSVPSAVKKLLKERNFDLVVDDLNKIPFYTPLYVKKPLLAIAHHFFGTSIYRETDVVRGSYVYLAERLVNLVYRHTPFAVVSQSTKQECLDRGFAESNLHIIRNAIDQSQFPMKVGQKDPIPTIAYFSRVKKYKSPDHLLQAFVGLQKVLPNAQLWFIGDGDYRPELERQAVAFGVAENVIFHGRVSEQAKLELLSRAWCVVNTSKKEGWGITNIEANACGTLTIAANVPGLRDSVLEGSSGLLYPYGDIEILKDQIVQICTNTLLRNSLSDGAVRWASSFSWDDEAQKMLNLCIAIIDSTKSHR